MLLWNSIKNGTEKLSFKKKEERAGDYEEL